ncbi:transposase [Paenibacillus sp. SSG-1]|uniref:Transposase n=1 Tax=Paenibacillus antibioticophila TaxID=1274374 RepID=A0A920CIB4_9BACL|nr:MULTISPECIES: RNA-guided endonuclease TnpB family protein [Paenibacillus]OXL88278.1 transposase [Paenibacillus sp. SSG-1]OXL88288.1 transposase [Paenibacillus sp. SSG-1]GIO38124.1 transposase [Paenibacillus antibioticophila]
MLCTMKIKLLTDSEQHRKLLDTMKRFNEACNYISKVSFESKTFGKIGIQKLCYYDVRERFGLSAQLVVRSIGKVAESYKTERKSVHAFREFGAVVYDQRILSFKGLEYASILTLEGRIDVPMIISAYHKGVLQGRRVRGQADLILQDGSFYLLLVVDLPDGTPFEPEGVIGVDLGIANIAVDSTSEVFSGSKVNSIRARHRRLRKKLQAKGTKSAKRLLKKRRRKEQRFVRDINHCISKKIVEKAKGTRSMIALEDLKGIRERTEKTVKKAQRAKHSSWAFYQLRQFIEYKARLAGVPVVLVDPRNTSRTCPECGLIDKKNRATRDTFHCQCCGYAAPADNVAARIIASRATVI